MLKLLLISLYSKILVTATSKEPFSVTASRKNMATIFKDIFFGQFLRDVRKIQVMKLDVSGKQGEKLSCNRSIVHTLQKMKFSINDIFSKCDQITCKCHIY